MLITGRHYKPGSLGVFIPCGAVVSDKVAEAMWLLGKLGGPEKNVVCGVKKRGIWSNGLFYGCVDDEFTTENEGYIAYWNPEWAEGMDVAEEMEIKFPTQVR